MPLVREIIASSFHELQLYAPDEQVALVDIARGLRSLNTMIDSWSNEKLACVYTLEQTIVLQPGIAKYSIGPGGTIDTSKGGQRPLKLIEGPGAAYIQDTNSNNYLVDVITREKWNLIGNRTIDSNIPDTLWYDPQYPTAYLNVYPVPNIGYNLYFDSDALLSTMPSVDVDINLPPGYSKAFQHNLAIELYPMYPGAVLAPSTVANAREAKANIKRTNSRSIVAVYDSELISKATGGYNIYSDSYNAASGR